MLPYHSRIVSKTHNPRESYFVNRESKKNLFLSYYSRLTFHGVVNLVHNPKVRSFGKVLEPR